MAVMIDGIDGLDWQQMRNAYERMSQENGVLLADLEKSVRIIGNLNSALVRYQEIMRQQVAEGVAVEDHFHRQWEVGQEIRRLGGAVRGQVDGLRDQVQVEMRFYAGVGNELSHQIIYYRKVIAGLSGGFSGLIIAGAAGFVTSIFFTPAVGIPVGFGVGTVSGTVIGLRIEKLLPQPPLEIEPRPPALEVPPRREKD
ncbi:MAG: hypothetical protein WC371_04660 [Parachlamydiales bacterium]|jgi:hypothetical protein